MNKAKEILLLNEYTCVICAKEHTYTSTLRGVKPLFNWYNEGIDVKGGVAADKVVGRATAFLYILLNVGSLYAKVISEPALDLLNAYAINVEFDALVPNIINRKGDGICPFEEATLDVKAPMEAYEKICKKMEEISR